MVVVVGGNACSSSSSNGTSGAMGEHMVHSRPLSFLSALVSVTVYLFTAQALQTAPNLQVTLYSHLASHFHRLFPSRCSTSLNLPTVPSQQFWIFGPNKCKLNFCQGFVVSFNPVHDNICERQHSLEERSGDAINLGA